jgi:hypothetical protein
LSEQVPVQPDFALADMWFHLRQAWRRYQIIKGLWIGNESHRNQGNEKEIRDLEVVIKRLLENLHVNYDYPNLTMSHWFFGTAIKEPSEEIEEP